MSLSGFQKMQLRMNANGNSLREERIYDARKFLENSFEDDPSFRSDIQIIGKNKISARMNNFRKEGFLSPKLDIQSTIDNEFDQGDLLYFDDQYWLCTMKYNMHGIHYRGEVVQCNNVIYFQNPDSYDIHKMYVVAERPFSRSTEEDRYNIITTSIKEYRIRMQLNEISEKIFLGKRIAMGSTYNQYGEQIPDVYWVNARDAFTNSIMGEGFLVLNFMDDQYNEKTDSKDLLVASYREPYEKYIPLAGDSNIITSDNKFDIRIGGSSKNFVAKLYDLNKNELLDYDNIEFSWTIDANQLQLEYLDIIYENNSAIISCKKILDNAIVQNIIGSSFSLSISAYDVINNIDYATDTEYIKIKGLI